jgi:hypothetical protein
MYTENHVEAKLWREYKKVKGYKYNVPERKLWTEYKKTKKYIADLTK